MAKLLGKNKHWVVCIGCDNLYIYDSTDVIEEEIPGLTKDLNLKYKYVKCPCCGYVHIV